MGRSIEKGDRVIATKEIRSGWTGRVDKGEKGVVTEVRGWNHDIYEVSFENDVRLDDCRDDDIARI